MLHFSQRALKWFAYGIVAIAFLSIGPAIYFKWTRSKKVNQGAFVVMRETSFDGLLLFHGSSNKSIDILVPKAIHKRKHQEDSVIFATPYLDVAVTFMTRWDDSWATLKSFGGPWLFICSDEQRYRKEDKGGAVYVLSSDNFCSYPSRGLGICEWTGHKTVKPLCKLEFASTLKAMMDFGVQVFFVDR